MTDSAIRLYRSLIVSADREEKLEKTQEEMIRSVWSWNILNSLSHGEEDE